MPDICKLRNDRTSSGAVGIGGKDGDAKPKYASVGVGNVSTGEDAYKERRCSAAVATAEVRRVDV